MALINFPSHTFTPLPGNIFYLDTSFIIDGLSHDPNCLSFMSLILPYQLCIGDIICSETVHTLAITYFANDLKSILLGLKSLVRRNSAYRLKKALSTSLINLIDKNINYKQLYGAIAKLSNKVDRDLLLPYQTTAIDTMHKFISENNIKVLHLNDKDVYLADSLRRTDIIDSNDAYHIA